MSKLELPTLLSYTKSHAQSDGTAPGQVAIFSGRPSPRRRSLFYRFSKQIAYEHLANVIRDFLCRWRGLARHHAFPVRVPSRHETGASPRAHERGCADAESRS